MNATGTLADRQLTLATTCLVAATEATGTANVRAYKALAAACYHHRPIRYDLVWELITALVRSGTWHEHSTVIGRLIRATVELPEKNRRAAGLRQICSIVERLAEMLYTTEDTEGGSDAGAAWHGADGTASGAVSAPAAVAPAGPAAGGKHVPLNARKLEWDDVTEPFGDDYEDGGDERARHPRPQHLAAPHHAPRAPNVAPLSDDGFVLLLAALVAHGMSAEGETMLKLFMIETRAYGFVRLSAMARVFAQREMFDVAMALLDHIKSRDMVPDAELYRTLVNCAYRAKQYELAERLWDDMLAHHTPAPLSRGIVTTMMTVMLRTGRPGRGIELFESFAGADADAGAVMRLWEDDESDHLDGDDGGHGGRRAGNAPVFGVLLRCYAAAGRDVDPVLTAMQSSGVRPNVFHLASALTACGADVAAAQRTADQFLTRFDVAMDRVAYNCLLGVCAAAADVDAAERVLVAMREAGMGSERDTQEHFIATLLAAAQRHASPSRASPPPASPSSQSAVVGRDGGDTDAGATAVTVAAAAGDRDNPTLRRVIAMLSEAAQKGTPARPMVYARAVDACLKVGHVNDAVDLLYQQMPKNGRTVPLPKSCRAVAHHLRQEGRAEIADMVDALGKEAVRRLRRDGARKAARMYGPTTPGGRNYAKQPAEHAKGGGTKGHGRRAERVLDHVQRSHRRATQGHGGRGGGGGSAP